MQVTSEILLFIFCFIYLQNVFIQAAPIVIDETENIVDTLARLHKEVDRLRRRLDPMPDLITFASNNIVDRLHRYIHIKTARVDPNTVYVDLKIDVKDDKIEKKYTNFYVDTKRDINAGYTNLDDISNNIDTKIIHLKIDSTINEESYRRFRRQRRTR